MVSIIFGSAFSACAEKDSSASVSAPVAQVSQESGATELEVTVQNDGIIENTLKVNATDAQKNTESGIDGTVIPLSKKDGAILNPYVYYCGFENGAIDWDSFSK